MTDRRGNGNGNGNGHYRGEGAHSDPTENVKDLQAAGEKRQDDLRAALAERLDQRDKLREIHRLEIAAKDAEIQAKETERIDAVNDVEKTRVDATFAEQRQATATAETSRRAEQAALSKEVATTANVLATQTAAATGRSGISTPLLLTLATFGGGMVVFLVQQALRTTP